jgi:hypothetical protein
MAGAVSRRDVEKTVKTNEELIKAADQEVQRLRTERKRSEKVITRAKKNGRRSRRKVGA